MCVFLGSLGYPRVLQGFLYRNATLGIAAHELHQKVFCLIGNGFHVLGIEDELVPERLSENDVHARIVKWMLPSQTEKNI